MADNGAVPIVSSVVITEVKDETPDSVIDNKLADYYRTLPSAIMKPLSFDLDDDEEDAPAQAGNNAKVGVATVEIKHHAPASNQFRVMSRFRSESRSSSFESSSSTSTSSSSSSSSTSTNTGGGVGLGALAPSLRLESIKEAREMRVTQQVTSPIHLKVITSRNRIHMQHVRSIQEFRSKM